MPELVILWGDGPGNRKLPLSPEGFSSVFPSDWGSLWDPSLSLCSFALTPSTGGVTPHPNNSSNLSLQLQGYCIVLSLEAENQKVIAELSSRCFVELFWEVFLLLVFFMAVVSVWFSVCLLYFV